jgi:uncharacterized protein (TIGR00730 family)
MMTLPSRHPIRCVTVYGSSSSAIDESFKVAAGEAGSAIARAGWIQVNGGGAYGVMGSASDGGLGAGGIVDCVIDRMFVPEMHKGQFRETVVTDSMTQRKAELYKRGDAFMCLPGGLGTLEEAAEVMSWLQLGLHSKCIVFVNTNGFYNSLWEFVTQGVAKKFVSHVTMDGIFLAVDAAEAVAYVQRFDSVGIDTNSIRASAMAAEWTKIQSRPGDTR